MAFVQNLPFISILLTLIVAVITSVIGRRKAIWVTTALITAVTALMLALTVRLYYRYHTLNVDEIIALAGKEEV